MTKNILSLSLVLAAFIFLLSLGTWQTQRHYWKQDLLSRIKTGMASTPTTYNNWLNKKIGTLQGEFANVSMSGRWLKDKTVYVYAIRKPYVGKLVFTPLLTNTGQTIFVNRGFFASILGQETEISKDSENSLVNVKGIIRLPEKRNMFTPDPDIKTKTWYIADINSMKQAISVKDLQDAHYVEILGNSAEKTSFMRRTPNSLLASISNRHFEYAVTWFGLAAALFFVFVFYVRFLLKGASS